MLPSALTLQLDYNLVSSAALHCIKCSYVMRPGAASALTLTDSLGSVRGGTGDSFWVQDQVSCLRALGLNTLLRTKAHTRKHLKTQIQILHHFTS